MTNKYMYFIANWKMFGGLNTLNSLHKVESFFKKFKKNKFIKIVYCPPSTLIRPMSKKLQKYLIFVNHTKHRRLLFVSILLRRRSASGASKSLWMK